MKSPLVCLLILLTITAAQPTFAVSNSATPQRNIHAATRVKPTPATDGTPPPQPRRVATLTADYGYQWSVVVGNYAYLYTKGYDYIYKYDITNPINPTLISNTQIYELLNLPIAETATTTNTIYLAGPNTVFVLDITGEATLRATYSDVPESITALAVANDWLYVLGATPTDTGGTTAYTLTAIHPTNGITTTPLGEHTACPALQVIATVMAIHCDTMTTLYALDDPATPTPYATADLTATPGACLPIHLAPPYLYLDNQLYPTDQNGVLQPLHTIPESNPAYSYTALTQWGDYLLRVDTANGTRKANLVDIQNPTTAIPIGNPFLMESRGCGESLQSDGDMLYTLTETGFDFWQLEAEYVQHLPLVERYQPFDPSLKDEVGLFIKGTPGANLQLFTLQLDGTRPKLIYDSGVGRLLNVFWSPEGTRLLLTVEENNQAVAYLMNIDGTGVTRLSIQGNISEVQWSPDGRRLLFTDSEAMRFKIFDILTGNTYSFSGTYHTIVRNIEWSPDSQTIAYTDDIDPDPSEVLLQIFTIDANDGTVRQVTTGSSSVVFGGWVNHGTQFIATLGEIIRGDIALFAADGTYIRTLVRETFFKVAPNQHQFVYGTAEGYLNLFDLTTSTEERISPPQCWGREYCFLYGPYWSPSATSLNFGTITLASPGHSNYHEVWIVPLSPIPQVPAAPFARDLHELTWITDRFLANDVMLVDRESGVRRVLFPPNDTVWWNYGWRHLP